MKSIEMKSEGYTYRYDFALIPSTEETFNPDIVTPIEPLSNAEESLRICLDLLRCAFGKDQVRRALLDLSEIDY